MTMVEHGWTSVLKKQMIELELNLSKLTDFIMHQWLTSGTVPDRYPVFLPARLPDRSKLYVPRASSSLNLATSTQLANAMVCHFVTLRCHYCQFCRRGGPPGG